MTAVLSDAEIQALRRHLEWGNINVAGYPYTPDGFYEVFVSVIAPNLQTGGATSATTAVAASSTTTVTPLAMPTDLVVNARLVVDVGDNAEIVVVQAASGSTFTAAFANAHPVTGYPIAVQSGLAELRMLLHFADKARFAMFAPRVAKVAGIKSIDKGDVVYQDTGSLVGKNGVLSGIRAQYEEIVGQIALLVRVPRNPDAGGGGGRLESY